MCAQYDTNSEVLHYDVMKYSTSIEIKKKMMHSVIYAPKSNKFSKACKTFVKNKNKIKTI